MPAERPTQAIAKSTSRCGHAGLVEDRADQHEHRQRQQRILGNAGLHVLRRGQQAPPLRIGIRPGDGDDAAQPQRRANGHAGHHQQCEQAEQRGADHAGPFCTVCAARHATPAATQRNGRAQQRREHREPPAWHAHAHRRLAVTDLVADDAAEEHGQQRKQQCGRAGGKDLEALPPPLAAAVIEELDAYVPVTRGGSAGAGQRHHHHQEHRDLLAPGEGLIGEVAREHVAQRDEQQQRHAGHGQAFFQHDRHEPARCAHLSSSSAAATMAAGRTRAASSSVGA